MSTLHPLRIKMAQSVALGPRTLPLLPPCSILPGIGPSWVTRLDLCICAGDKLRPSFLKTINVGSFDHVLEYSGVPRKTADV